METWTIEMSAGWLNIANYMAVKHTMDQLQTQGEDGSNVDDKLYEKYNKTIINEPLHYNQYYHNNTIFSQSYQTKTNINRMFFYY